MLQPGMSAFEFVPRAVLRPTWVESHGPGVEYGSEPDTGAEVLGVCRDGDQGLGGGFEQQVIDDRLVLIGNVGDRSRQVKTTWK